MNRLNRILQALILALGLTLGYTLSLSAQEGYSEGFTLEEIVVTAEKRTENIQDLPSSVSVLTGDSLMELGKTTTAQILEDVPNVRWSAQNSFTGAGVASADSGITIRGVQQKQTSDGQPPAATATYVDDVFQGIGGNYDVARVEVLRGPQGTLYGRSATGGVVAFHTNDPKLSEFSGIVSGEAAKQNSLNFQGAINIPIGESFALRTAAHKLARDGFFNKDGGHTETREGRIKFLYQPSDKLNILFTGSFNEVQSNSGGSTVYLTSPTTFDYNSNSTDVVLASSWARTIQGALNFSYNFEHSTLTYIGAYRKYVDDKNPGTVMAMGQWVARSVLVNPGETFHTEEIRLASDSESWLKWLIGANYYYSKFDRVMTGYHVSSHQGPGGPPDDPNTSNVFVFSMRPYGHYENSGIFTEETFNLRDDMRITAGLRYDESEVLGQYDYDYNMNVNIWGNAFNPAEIRSFNYAKTLQWSNITYKARWEYDITPNNMLYALTATGFQPGDIRITSKSVYGNGMNQAPTDVLFFALPYDEEKLISYEVGSKNQFLNNTLQLNLSAFYYNYDGYRSAINTATMGPPSYVIVATPLRMIGAEADSTWLVTSEDKLSLSVALLDARIMDYPEIEGFGPSKKYLQLERLPNNPPLTADLNYDHTFSLADGSILAPRATLRYTSGLYVSQLTESQVKMGQMPYAWQKAYMLGDVGITWISSTGMYSASAIVRNVTDEEYKTGVGISSWKLTDNTATPGDPRTWSMNFSIRF